MPPYTLLSAGSNAQGQLATGDTEDVHSFTPCSFLDCDPGTVPLGTQRIANIACGANHTLLLLERTTFPENSSDTSTELWGSGDGSKGQLGPSITSSTQVFQPLRLDLERLSLQGYTITQIATCWETSYVALSSRGRDSVLLSMGADDFGDLGVGGTKAKGKQVDGGLHIVDLRSSLALDGRLGANLTIRSLTTGLHHVLVRLATEDEDGNAIGEYLVGWGTSRHGQLGDWKDPTKGRPIPCISSPRLVSPQPERAVIRQVAAGTHHTVFLYSNGRVSALGSNRKGQLIALEDLRDVSHVGCTWNGTYAVVQHQDAWSVVSTGNHAKGQLGRQIHDDTARGHSLAKVHFPLSRETHALVKLACGSEHVLAMTTSARNASHTSLHEVPEIWGWGWNEHGNLGLGHTEDQNLPIKLWPPRTETRFQSRMVDVWAGCGTSWILLSN